MKDWEIHDLKQRKFYLHLGSTLLCHLSHGFPHIQLNELQLTYWRWHLDKLIRVIENTLNSACQSEWWQMILAAKIKIGYEEVKFFDEETHPLEQVDDATVSICKLKVQSGQGDKAIVDALAQKGKQPAKLRQVLQYLAKNERALKSTFNGVWLLLPKKGDSDNCFKLYQPFKTTSSNTNRCKYKRKYEDHIVILEHKLTFYVPYHNRFDLEKCNQVYTSYEEDYYFFVVGL